MKLRIALPLAAIAAAVPLLTTTAFAKPDQEKKEYLCHFTASERNPVVALNVGNSAVEKHLANHHPDVHQGEDLSGEQLPMDCGGEAPPEE